MWIALATFVVGLGIGYENARLRDEILSVKHSLLEKKETRPTTVSSNPDLIREDQIGSPDSSVILPKSPQRIEWEESQEIEKLNRTGAPR